MKPRSKQKKLGQKSTKISAYSDDDNNFPKDDDSSEGDDNDNLINDDTDNEESFKMVPVEKIQLEDINFADYGKRYKQDDKEVKPINRFLKNKLKRKKDEFVIKPSMVFERKNYDEFRKYIDFFIKKQQDIANLYDTIKKEDRSTINDTLSATENKTIANFVDYALIGSDTFKKISIDKIALRDSLLFMQDFDNKICLSILSNDVLFLYALAAYSDIIETYGLPKEDELIQKTVVFSPNENMSLKDSLNNDFSLKFNAENKDLIELNVPFARKVVDGKYLKDDSTDVLLYSYGDGADIEDFLLNAQSWEKNKEEDFEIINYRSITKCDYNTGYYVPNYLFINKMEIEISFCFLLEVNKSVYLVVVCKNKKDSSIFFAVGIDYDFILEFGFSINSIEYKDYNKLIKQRPIYMYKKKRENIDVKIPYSNYEVIENVVEIDAQDKNNPKIKNILENDLYKSKIYRTRKVRIDDKVKKNIIFFKGKAATVLQTDIFFDEALFFRFSYSISYTIDDLLNKGFRYEYGGWTFSNINQFIIFIHLIYGKSNRHYVKPRLMDEENAFDLSEVELKGLMGFIKVNKNILMYFSKLYTLLCRFLRKFVSFSGRGSIKKYILMTVDIFNLLYLLSFINKSIITQKHINNVALIVKFMQNKFLMQFIEIDFRNLYDILNTFVNFLVTPKHVTDESYKILKESLIYFYKICVFSLDGNYLDDNMVDNAIIQSIQKVVIRLYLTFQGDTYLTTKTKNIILSDLRAKKKELTAISEELGNLLKNSTDNKTIRTGENNTIIIGDPNVGIKKKQKVIDAEIVAINTDISIIKDLKENVKLSDIKGLSPYGKSVLINVSDDNKKGIASLLKPVIKAKAKDINKILNINKSDLKQSRIGSYIKKPSRFRQIGDDLNLNESDVEDEKVVKKEEKKEDKKKKD